MTRCLSMKKVTPVIFSRVLLLLNLSRGGTLGTYHDKRIATLRCCIFTATKMFIESQPSPVMRDSGGASVYVCLPIRCGPTLTLPRIPNGSNDNFEPLYCGSPATHETSCPGYPHEHAHCPSLLEELNVAVSAGEPATAPVYVANLSMETGQFLP